MARQTLKLEAIKHEKSRLATFKKRKHSLMKKAYEFTTLCDVEVCIIIYGPKLKNLPVKPETWTSEEGELIGIIRKYKKTIDTGDHGQQRTSSLSKFGKNKMRQVDGAAMRVRKKNCVAEYTTWDERMDSFSEDRLKMILGTMDKKLEVADKKLSAIKGGHGHNVKKNAASRKLDGAKSPVNLQPDRQVCQKLPSDSSSMEIECGAQPGSNIPYTQLGGPVSWNLWPSYDNCIVSPESSGVFDENGVQVRK